MKYKDINIIHWWRYKHKEDGPFFYKDNFTKRYFLIYENTKCPTTGNTRTFEETGFTKLAAYARMSRWIELPPIDKIVELLDLTRRTERTIII